jgi:hypothetical protein
MLSQGRENYNVNLYNDLKTTNRFVNIYFNTMMKHLSVLRFINFRVFKNN